MATSAGSRAVTVALNVPAMLEEARGVETAIGRKLPGLLAHESMAAVLTALGGNMPLLRVREMLRFYGDVRQGPLSL